MSRSRIFAVAVVLAGVAIQLNAQQAELIATLRGHTKKIQAIEFSHSGTLIATTSDRTVRLWSSVTGESLATIVGNSEVLRMDWSSDDRKLAIDYKERGELVVWDVPVDQQPVVNQRVEAVYSFDLSKLLTTIEDGNAPLSFTPDGNAVLTVRYDPENKSSHRKSYLRLRRIDNGADVSSFQVPEGIYKVVWSPDGKTLAIIGLSFSPRVIDAATGRENGRLPYGNCWPWTMFGSDGCEPLRFSADGAVMLKEKEPLKLWDTKTVTLVAELRDAHLPATFSPSDGRVLATASADKKSVLLWRVKR